MNDVTHGANLLSKEGSATMYFARKMWAAGTDIGRKREVLLNRS